MRRLASIIAPACVALSLSACLSVVVEGTSSATASSSTTDTGDATDESGDGDPGDGDGDPGDGGSFRVAVIADSHVPPTGFDPGEDISLALARQRLEGAIDKINAIDPAPEFVVVTGDLVHAAYEGSDAQWYQDNPNAFADMAEILDRSMVPVYPLFGESDYGVPDFSKLLSHQLFAQFYARDPYYSVDHGGWRFVFSNSQFGQTFDEGTLKFDPTLETGSYGGTQLSWLAGELEAGMPTVLFTHFPLEQIAADEAPNNGIYTDLDAVFAAAGGAVQLILAAHLHEWTEDPGSFIAPQIGLGSTRYDTDNFIVIEFTANSSEYAIIDYAKIGWGTREAETWVYDGEPGPP